MLIEFITQPESFYYAVATRTSVLVIPCEAEGLLQDDTVHPISTTIVFNGALISVVNGKPLTPSPDFLIQPDDQGNMVGIIILNLHLLPVPSQLRCIVVLLGKEIQQGGNSTIFVGGMYRQLFFFLMCMLCSLSNH